MVLVQEAAAELRWPAGGREGAAGPAEGQGGHRKGQEVAAGGSFLCCRPGQQWHGWMTPDQLAGSPSGSMRSTRLPPWGAIRPVRSAVAAALQGEAGNTQAGRQ
jgi:hypothetical protein